MVTRELNTDISFTKEATELFNTVLDNQKEIIKKHNEIEALVEKNSDLFSQYNVLSDYMNITH